MPLEGKVIIQRELVNLVAGHWPNSKVKAVSTILGESAGYVGAYHDNLDSEGLVTSRDCGLFQINIPASEIGTAVEFELRTDNLDPAAYMPVVQNNINAAYKLYEEPWTRNGKNDVRRWQPWVAYTEGWATFPEWYVWHQDANGNPIGPWVPAPRCVHRAIQGTANFHLLIAADMNQTQAIAEAERLAGVFGIPNASFYMRNGVVSYHIPPKPTDPPADGIGPRPVPNDGF